MRRIMSVTNLDKKPKQQPQQQQMFMYTPLDELLWDGMCATVCDRNSDWHGSLGLIYDL